MTARLLLALTLIAASVVASPATVGAEDGCEAPQVNVLSEAEAAVSRPALRSPSEYALSNVYAQNSLATKPQFVYAEAGPQYAGAFEALAPVGSPPPPRAVSAYPAEDIPDQDDETWGGTSTTEVTPVSAFAASSGAQVLGVGDATTSNGRSFATTVVECDTVTVIAGWETSDVVLAPGVSYEQLGETVTLVVGPDGASADVDVTAVRSGEADAVPIGGRPADPVSDPMRDNGGPTLEAGEPRTETGDGYASASGGGFNFLFADPETGQGAAYRIGSVNASITVLGALEAPVAVSEATASPASGSLSTGALPARREPAASSASTLTGTPPPPSDLAVQAIQSVLVSNVDTITFRVVRRSWLALWALLAAMATITASWTTVVVGRRRFPTLDWIARQSARSSRRFRSMYLRW